jgi:hypothetical protein
MPLFPYQQARQQGDFSSTRVWQARRGGDYLLPMRHFLISPYLFNRITINIY